MLNLDIDGNIDTNSTKKHSVNVISLYLHVQVLNYWNSLDDFIISNDMQTLSEEDKWTFYKLISDDEIFKSIKKLTPGKSPVSDWLPAELYKCVWHDKNVHKLYLYFVNRWTIYRTKVIYYYIITQKRQKQITFNKLETD